MLPNDDYGDRKAEETKLAPAGYGGDYPVNPRNRLKDITADGMGEVPQVMARMNEAIDMLRMQVDIVDKATAPIRVLRDTEKGDDPKKYEFSSEHARQLDDRVDIITRVVDQLREINNQIQL